MQSKAKRIYIVMGNHGTRKSSLLRSLSGVGVAAEMQLARMDGRVDDVLTLPASLQEMDILPDELLANLSRRKCQFVLLALRNGPFQSRSVNSRNRPGATDYIKALISAGHAIENPIILLGSANLLEPLPGGMRVHHITNHEHLSNNQLAAIVRPLWKFM